MLKFYSILIGENPNYTKFYQPASKRKIALYANCLMIPVILWFINSYLLVKHVLEGGVIAALITAFIASFIIFIIERAIIMSTGGRAIFWFRVFLGLLIASLGSISMDEVIFKHDIDNQVAKYKQTEINNASSFVDQEFVQKIDFQQSLVNQRSIEWKGALQAAKDESDGSGGSGQKRVGKIALFKMDIASKLESDYNKENQELISLKTALETRKANAKLKAESDFDGSALLLRIRAMFDLIAQDGFMLGVYILFTLFLFCLEFLVVVIKMSSKESIDEELEKAREALLRAKTKKTLQRTEIFFNPESFVPAVQNAKAALQRNPTSIFS